MSFQPILPLAGYNGWSFLKRTQAQQEQVFQSGSSFKREAEYFRSNIGKVGTARAFVDDRRLLKVALTAFGLEGDLEGKAFIRKILQEGGTERTAFANRLADKRYLNFARTFDFAANPPATRSAGFADAILKAYAAKSFEAAVGAQSEVMRLALNAERELQALAQSNASNDTLWFSIMGSKPLRQVFETAFTLPGSFGALDIDQQLKSFKSKAQKMFGTDQVTGFSKPEALEKLLRHYIMRAEVGGAAKGHSAAQSALQLMSGLAP